MKNDESVFCFKLIGGGHNHYNSDMKTVTSHMKIFFLWKRSIFAFIRCAAENKNWGGFRCFLEKKDFRIHFCFL